MLQNLVLNLPFDLNLLRNAGGPRQLSPRNDKENIPPWLQLPQTPSPAPDPVDLQPESDTFPNITTIRRFEIAEAKAMRREEEMKVRTRTSSSVLSFFAGIAPITI